MMDRQDNTPSSSPVLQQWRQQFAEAMSLDGDPPSCCSMIMHVVCFFWKVGTGQREENTFLTKKRG